MYPAKVQGEGAAESIAAGIRYLDQTDVDVIIIGRGGGSAEDLWAFNEEIVAQAIFQCSKPVISAVGHETDFTIADFTADLRAPTPSAAAELAVFDLSLFEKELADYQYSFYRSLSNKIDKVKHLTKQYGLKIETLSPQNQLLQKSQLLTDLADRLEDEMDKVLRKSREALTVRSEHLLGLSPLKRLSEGYAFVTDKEELSLRGIKQIAPDDPINLYVADGVAQARVISTKEVQYE